MATTRTTLEALFATEDVETILTLARRHPEIAERLRHVQAVLDDADSAYYATVLSALPGHADGSEIF